MKKILLLTLIAILAALTACGGDPPAPPNESADEPAPAAESESSSSEEVSAEEVTIRLWTHQNDAFNSGYQNLADAYMVANPNVTIELETFDYDTYIQTLQTALPAGTEADIMQMFGSWVCSYAEGDNLAAVPANMLSLADAQDQIFDAQLGGYTCDDALYGIPQEFNIEYGATLVNTQVAADAGVDLSEGWATWDDFIADAQAMTETQDGIITRAGYHFTAADALSAAFYSLILQNGGEYLTNEGFAVNTDEARAALELLQSFVDAGIVDPVLFNGDSNWVGNSYFDGSSAMGMVGPWAVPSYSGDYPEVAEVTEYVKLPTAGEDAFVAASGWGLAVSANSPAQTTAWDFVSFVALNAENATTWNLASGTLPALKANASGANSEALVAEFAHFAPFLEILPNARYEGGFPDRDLVWYEITYPNVLNFLQGNASVDETLEAIQREVSDSLGDAVVTAPAEPEVEAEPATIRLWTHQNDAFNSGYQDLADAYMAANPHITVELETFDYDTYIQTLQTALPAGTEADVMQMFGSWVCSYADGNNLAAVPADVLSLADAQEQIFPAQIGGYTCGDALYGIPQEFNIEYGATLVNTQVAADAGVDLSNGWATWDDFIADAQAMTQTQDGIITRAGYHFTAADALSAAFYSLILQNGGEYLTDAGFDVNTDEARAALELLQSFVDAGIVDPVLFNGDSNWVGNSYFDGSSAMGMIGPWAVPSYSGDYPEVAEVTEYVKLPTAGGDSFVAASGWGLAVSANSPSQAAAWDFVSFVALNGENATAWNLASGTLPALQENASGANGDALVAEFAHFAPFLEILPNAQYEGAFPDRDLVWYEITYPNILNFLQGNASIDETLEAIQREVSDSLE